MSWPWKRLKREQSGGQSGNGRIGRRALREQSRGVDDESFEGTGGIGS